MIMEITDTTLWAIAVCLFAVASIVHAWYTKRTALKDAETRRLAQATEFQKQILRTESERLAIYHDLLDKGANITISYIDDINQAPRQILRRLRLKNSNKKP